MLLFGSRSDATMNSSDSFHSIASHFVFDLWLSFLLLQFRLTRLAPSQQTVKGLPWSYYRLPVHTDPNHHPHPQPPFTRYPSGALSRMFCSRLPRFYGGSSMRKATSGSLSLRSERSPCALQILSRDRHPALGYITRRAFDYERTSTSTLMILHGTHKKAPDSTGASC